MALTASSTYQNAVDQLMNNLLWDGDRAKALLALEATRWLKIRRPRQNSSGNAQFTYSELSEMEKDLREFVRATDTTNKTTFVEGRMELP